MRTILFFDLPSVSLEDQRNYRHFVKSIKAMGFIMLQESVYYMLSLNQQNVDSKISSISKIIPSKGSVIALTVTEKQFSSIKILLGENKTDVISTDERTVFF